jgi:hypothetical protein
VDLKLKQPNSTINAYDATYALYQRYGSLLLGYITEVLNDNILAEQCLIEVFKQVQGKIGEYTQADSCWIRLQRLAKNILGGYQKPVTDGSNYTNGHTTTHNKYTGLMSPEQQLVFCGMHYQQKDVNALAAELNKTQNHIRQLLREALIIIRNEQKR